MWITNLASITVLFNQTKAIFCTTIITFLFIVWGNEHPFYKNFRPFDLIDCSPTNLNPYFDDFVQAEIATLLNLQHYL